MNWATSYMFDMEGLEFELECLGENLAAVHTAMLEDGGANWEQMTNALYSVLCYLRNIDDRIRQRTEEAGEECRTSTETA